jgi:hypothetical protein
VQALALDDPCTWPSGGQRRVVECAPLEIGEHWKALSAAPRLVAALDAILGHGAWEVPTNTPGEQVRYFYAPVVFPEDATTVVPHQPNNRRKQVSRREADECAVMAPAAHAAVGDGDDAGVSDVGNGACSECVGDIRAEDSVGAGAASEATAGQRPAERLAELMSWKEERRTFGQGPSCRVPPSRWQPVNRRRFRGKGWHIDIGPGFQGGWTRTLAG